MKTEASSFSLHGCVEVVLDGVVRATWHHLGHFSPLGSKLLEQLEDEFVFFCCEGRLVDCSKERIRREPLRRQFGG